jgi:transposase
MADGKVVYMIPWGYEMNNWADDLYQRIRPLLTPAQKKAKDRLRTDEYNEFAADMLRYAAKHGMLTASEIERSRRSIEAGAGNSFRKAKDQFLRMLAETTPVAVAA